MKCVLIAAMLKTSLSLARKINNVKNNMLYGMVNKWMCKKVSYLKITNFKHVY